MQEELKKFIHDHEGFSDLKQKQEDYIRFCIDEFFKHYQPERSKREDSYLVEFGTDTGISFITQEGIKTLNPDTRYDKDLNEI